MGVMTLYLIPEVPVEPRDYARRVIQVLLDMQVIANQHYDDRPDWWVAGEGAAALFEDGDPETAGFEYCVIGACDQPQLIPDAPAVAPACPHCGADLADRYYERVGAIEESWGEDASAKGAAYRALRLGCPACGRAFPLDQLKDKVGIHFSQVWVNFEDPQDGEGLSVRWRAAFDRATGCKHRYLEYWYS